MSNRTVSPSDQRTKKPTSVSRWSIAATLLLTACAANVGPEVGSDEYYELPQEERMVAAVAQGLTVETVDPPAGWTGGRIYVGRRVSDGTSWVCYDPHYSGDYDCSKWKQLGNAVAMFKDLWVINGGSAGEELVVHGDNCCNKTIDGVSMNEIAGWNAPSGGLATIEINVQDGDDIIDAGDSMQTSFWGSSGADTILTDSVNQVKGGSGNDRFVAMLGGNTFYGEGNNDLFCNMGGPVNSPLLFDGGSGTDYKDGTAVMFTSIEDTSGNLAACEDARDDVVNAVQD